MEISIRQEKAGEGLMSESKRKPKARTSKRVIERVNVRHGHTLMVSNQK